MKSHLFRASSILAVLTLPFAMGLSSTAQQQTRQQQPDEQQELRIPELAVQDIDAEALRVRIPHCLNPPVVQTHDVADNFISPGNPVALSPALINFLASTPIKGYDDPRINRVFADSFKLQSCKVCYATLEVGVKHYAGAWGPNAPNWSNDTLLLGAAPFTTTLNQYYRFIGPVPIWTSTSSNPTVRTFGITPGGLGPLNQYLFTGANSPTIDLIAQDDTDFDYVKLSVWY